MLRPFLSDLDIWLIDEFGKKLKHKHIEPDSLVSYMARWVQGAFDAANYSQTDTTDNVRSVGYTNPPTIEAPATDASYGIVVGTGTTAVAITQTKLVAQIGHGNGAGQLYHQAMGLSALTVSAPDAYFTVQRTLNNNSGADITIEEVGLYVSTQTNLWKIMFARDVTGGILVANAKSFVGQYTFKVTA